MSVTAAVRGSMVLLLSMSVVKGQDGWSVTYTSDQICAPRGSTVNISCTFTYPNITEHKLEKKFWFKNSEEHKHNNVEEDPQFSDRVKNTCTENQCILTITDLRPSDSATYKFRIMTNKDKYSGEPGVRVYFTDLQVVVSQDPSRSLQCLSICPLDTSFIWFKDGQKIYQKTPKYSPGHDLSNNRYSCAAEGYEEFRTSSVYAPGQPLVSVSPSAEIVEGTAVNLTCSSDANPAVTYIWYKNPGPQNLRHLQSGPLLTFSSFKSTDSGEYFCEAENELGTTRSKHISVTVKYDGGIIISIMAGAVPAVLLVVVFICVVLWIRKKRTFNESSSVERRPNNRTQVKVDEQEEPQYANVRFSKDQANPRRNIRPTQPTGHTEQQEVPVYENVKVTRAARR